MKCDNCKKTFEAGNRPDGLPNGVGMVLENGKQITLCADCIILLGKQAKSGQATFLDKLKEQ